MGATLAKATYHLRRLVLERFGLLIVLGSAVLLAGDAFTDLGRWTGGQRWPRLIAAFLPALVLLYRILVGRPVRQSRLAAFLDRLEVGLLLLCAVFVAIQGAGGPGSWAQPLAYLAVAILVGFNSRAVGLALTLAALGLQIALHHAMGQLPGSWEDAARQMVLIVGFALANSVLLQGEVARRRREYERRMAQEIRSMREEARDYRLISTALSSSNGRDRLQVESKLACGAVEAIHQGLFFMLETLKQALNLQTCVLLWLDSSGERLRIKELVTDSDMVSETPVPARAGAIGGVLKNRLLLNLRSPRQGIPYYGGPERIGAFVGVPVLEDGHLRGVLCADRRVDRPFIEAEERLMVQAAAQVIRAIQTERVFAAVERSKYEHERFYQASTMLNGALTLAQVYGTAFAAAREIVDFDFGAVTLFDRERRRHTICRVIGDNAQAFEGQSFKENAGLVSMVVKNKHFLPAVDGPLREREMVVFTRRLRPPPMRSLVVLPLIVQDNALGTFILAAKDPGRFPKRMREMLGVISNQVAVSIENAKMYKQMEEMATTDGLTGLPNHRTFQARFSEMLYRAERHRKPVSVVLIDVDHFKTINDTHGHPVGDMVLKRLAALFAEQVRKVDHVARYGGEEFVMVLEETDSEGAKLLCDRVRQTVGAQVLSSDKGSFRITISLGIAAYPADGKEKALLIERADQALYGAKSGGRNRAVRFAELKPGRGANAATG